MLSKAIQEGINEQIKHEINSAYLYLAMAAYCETLNLGGFATWLRLQWQEELSHAMKLFGMMNARGAQVILQAIDKPPVKYRSPMDVFQQVLAHEQKVTALINKLYGLAIKENDYATQIELQWFVKEQVEEERAARDIIEQLRMVGDSGTPLMMLDRQLGARSAGH
jgi:ferritin